MIEFDVAAARRVGERWGASEDFVGCSTAGCLLLQACAEIERLRAEVAVLKDSAEKLYDIAASGAEPPHRRRMLDQMAMESFAENG